MKYVEQLVGSLGSTDFVKLLNSIKEQPNGQTDAESSPRVANLQDDAQHDDPKPQHWGNVGDGESVASSVSDRRVKIIDDTKTLENPSDAMGSIRFGNEEDLTFFGRCLSSLVLRTYLMLYHMAHKTGRTVFDNRLHR
jgi:hypothetical protein